MKSNNRKHRRATAAVEKLAAKRSNPTDWQGAVESLRKQTNESFQTLNDNQVALGKIFNEQKQALENAFVLVDAHQHVTRRILNDMFWDRARPAPLHEDDVAWLEELEELPLAARLEQFQRHAFLKVWGQEIDYGWYFEQYNLHRAIIVGFMSLRASLGLDAEEDVKNPEPPDENDMEFGGDYEQNQVHGDPRQADPR